MDDRDRLLLTLLRRDARRSIVALARDLNLSRSATQDRLAKLQASGRIKGFTIIEGSNEGARQSAYLSISFTPGFACAQVAPELKRIPGVALVHSLSGPVDLIVRIDGESVADIESARSAVAAVRGVGAVSTAMVLERDLG